MPAPPGPSKLPPARLEVLRRNYGQQARCNRGEMGWERQYTSLLGVPSAVGEGIDEGGWDASSPPATTSVTHIGICGVRTWLCFVLGPQPSVTWESCTVGVYFAWTREWSLISISARPKRVSTQGDICLVQLFSHAGAAAFLKLYIDFDGKWCNMFCQTVLGT